MDDRKRKEVDNGYSQLLALRKKYSTLFSAPETIVMQTEESDWTHGRRIMLLGEKEHLVLLGNFSNETLSMTADFPALGQWTEPFNASQLTITEENQKQSVTLPPHTCSLFIYDAHTSGNESIGKMDPCIITLQDRQIHVACATKIHQINLYTIGGTLVHTLRGQETMDVSRVEKGIYIVTVQTENRVFYHKKIIL